MTLFEKQVEFGNCISTLIPWINSLVYNNLPIKCTMADGNIDSLRKCRVDSNILKARFDKFGIKIVGNLPSSFTFIKCRDLTHLETGCHYRRLAQDLNLFADGKWITMTTPEEEHTFMPLWIEIGRYWKDLSPLARWGGDFEKKDFNHFSFEHEGVA